MPKSHKCVGFIQVGFADGTSGEFINLGGIGCLTIEELEREWSNIPALEASAESAFMADRLDADGDIVDDRRISAETIEALTGRALADLIADGRRRLAEELVSMGGPKAAEHIPGTAQRRQSLSS